MSYNADDNQWKPVVLKKTGNHVPKSHHGVHAGLKDGSIATEKKYKGGQNSNYNHNAAAAKIEAEDEDFKPVRVTHDFKVALMQARAALKLTQKDLAVKINVKPTLIQEYESGKAVPDGQIINKLNRVLKVTLPKIPKKKKKSESE